MTSDSNFGDVVDAFLDANIILEGKPPADLPWREISDKGTIRALIVPKAMEEIDAKKRDGRLGPHARAFNRLIASAVVKGEAVVLREANPRVELELAICSRIKWDDFEDLDPEDGDSRIVLEALHVRNAVSDRHILVSHDIKPLAYARAQGLAVHQASDDWLRPIEPSPKDKEIQRLKGQLAELRKDEPTFEISIEVADADPPTFFKVSSLNTTQKNALIRAIADLKGRKKENGERNFGIGLDYDSSYDEKFNDFINKRIPDFVDQYAEKLELLFNQRRVKISVVNKGQLRADHLVLSVKVNGGWINERLVAVSPSGPKAPTPKPGYLRSLGLRGNGLRDILPGRVGRHEFESTRAAARSFEMRETCEDFHSGQEYVFNGVVLPTPQPEPLEIAVSLTAANLRGQYTDIFKLNKQIIPCSPGDLVDLETLTLRRNFSIQGEMQRLVHNAQYDEIEWDEDDDD